MATTHRYELLVAPGDRDVASARLWAAGAVGVWEPPGRVVAWFDHADVVLPDPLVGGTWSLEPDRDWQAEWKATIVPVHAGRFAVVPTWLADTHIPADDETTLVLDPGRAFGSGHHATTTLCLEALDALDRAGRLAGRTVADIGCGSGILAIAAAARGARAAGTDIDADAITVSRENATRNDVEVALVQGSVAAATELLGGPADLVVANLITDTVVQLAGELVAATAPGGTLIVSGVASQRADRARDALTAGGAELDPPRERDGWVVLTGRRAGEPGGAVGGPSATLHP